MPLSPATPLGNLFLLLFCVISSGGLVLVAQMYIIYGDRAE